MTFSPEPLSEDANDPLISHTGGPHAQRCPWRPVWRHACTFGPDLFASVMDNLMLNPNINSSWLFRADILHDQSLPDGASSGQDVAALGGPHSGHDPAAHLDLPDAFRGPCAPTLPVFDSFQCRRLVIRRLIPRNAARDAPLDQTCLYYRGLHPNAQHPRSLVVYLPHVSSVSDMPFYHPAVKGIAYFYEWSMLEGCGSVTVYYWCFEPLMPQVALSEKLSRTAFQLLKVIYKHGEGRVRGYVKRVQHDTLASQAAVQDRYASLKLKYARHLIDAWAETTDPAKHVFEDLGIAAFLMELWADTYRDAPFPGFVDIGCGNGLLVYLLNQEGFSGWGFDARSRKSWAHYDRRGNTLQELVLLPSLTTQDSRVDDLPLPADMIHDGHFLKGTFIISNHADELTPWTPILATLSECPFLMIPCCSHDLTAARFRAPAPQGIPDAKSTYASFVAWLTNLATDCGWVIEKEMLRIPSTRNCALLGRRREKELSLTDVEAVVRKCGGATGYADRVRKLTHAGRL